MGHMYDDMPPLVDSADYRGYPPTGFGAKPSAAEYGYPPFPGAHQPPGAGGHWSGTGWGDPVASPAGWAPPAPGLTAAGYPTPGAQPFPLWSQSPNAWSTPPQHASPWVHHGPNLADGWNPSPLSGANYASGYIPSSSTLFANATPDRNYPSPHRRASSVTPGDLKRLSYSPKSLGIQRSPSVNTNRIEFVQRPLDWRQDFKFRTGLASLIPRRQRTSSGPAQVEFHDEIRREPHMFLQYNSFNPPVFLDLREDPMSIKFHALGRPFDRNDLLQYACEPPTYYMRLYHEKLPWYIDIAAFNGVAVTIHDLFDQIHDSLMTPIQNKHFYNQEMDDDDRDKVTLAFKERCADSLTEIGKGVRRIDFLRRRVIFEGLTRGRNGMWELKTRKR